MQSDLISISRIFTESLYRIPDYQRGYAWTSKQLKEFWADIEQLEHGKNHYTGVLTLELVPESEYEKWDDDRWIIQSKKYIPYFVVDGQQRLTTVLILLQCVIERLDENSRVNYTSKEEIRRKFIFESKDNGISRSNLFGYQKDNPSTGYLRTEIFLESTQTHPQPEETIYTYNLQAAKEFFSSKLKDFSLAEIELCYTKVTQCLLFNIYIMSNDIDVFVAFETMNNRGKPLSHLEILKTRLIYISTKFAVDPEEKIKLRGVINSCWQTAYTYLGKNKKRPLDDNEFLLAHFLLYFSKEIVKEAEIESSYSTTWKYRHDDYYKDYLLDEVFNIKCLRNNTDEKPPLTLKYIYDYASDLQESVKKYYEISNPHDSKFSSDEKKCLERICRINDSSLLILPLAVFLTEKSKAIRIKFVEVWEKVSFINGIIRLPDLTDPYLVALDIKSGRLTTQQAIDLMEKALAAALKRDEFKTELSSWVKRTGYYGWRNIKYFYFEYEEYLKSNSKTKREKLNWDEFSREKYESDYATIEHIYPQRADTLEWKNAFKNFTIKEKNILRNTLGNLIPLSRPKNASLGRKNFSEKKSNADNSVGYIYGCYSENEIALETEWTAKQIVLRGVRMLCFMEYRWGIPLGTNKEKLSILGLEFCLKYDKTLSPSIATVTIK